jgi:hypothetical protein
MLMGQDRVIGHLAQRQIVHGVRGNRPTALGPNLPVPARWREGPESGRVSDAGPARAIDPV